MKIQDIEKLIKMFEASTVVEIELANFWGQKIRLSKTGPRVKEVVTAAPPEVKAASEIPAVQETGKTKAKTAPEPPPENLKKTVAIVSPIVGTFYRAPAPDAAPYVEVGDIVKPGQVVCIVEAMKLMNEIESDAAGRIVKIMVKNEEPVQYNQELFLIEPL
jgi:acetyl-CoA carboxylase biotin carboxyl carrier protein